MNYGAIVGANMLLSACAMTSDGPPASTMTAPAGPHDGRWQAALTYDNTGDGQCLGIRMDRTIEVHGGRITGYINHPLAGTFTMTGEVDASGQMQDVTAVGSVTVVAITGRLDDETGTGSAHWQTVRGSVDCSGDISFRRT